MTSDGIVLVGGGLASQRCAETLRSRGYEGAIRIVSAEAERPYDRPPLSKQVLAGTMEESEAALRPRAWYEEAQVELLLGRAATRLEPAEHRLTLDDDSVLRYDRLLVATGSAPRMIPWLAHYENVFTVRTLGDARELRDRLRPGTRLALVGAGFIGQEIAATARGLGADVTVIEALPVPLAHILGEEVGGWFADLHRGQGVGLELGAKLSAARGNGSVEALVLESGREIDCEVVVVGVGVSPAADWLAGSGLDPAGVPTDAAGRTGVEDIYAAGDVARPFDPRVGANVRTEHWDAAVRQGAAAAKAMLGLETGDLPLPSFWSDQYGLRVQYVGHAGHADRVRVDGDPEGADFIAVYERDGLPVAGMAVGRPRELVALRREIELRNRNGNEPRKEATA